MLPDVNPANFVLCCLDDCFGARSGDRMGVGPSNSRDGCLAPFMENLGCMQSPMQHLQGTTPDLRGSCCPATQGSKGNMELEALHIAKSKNPILLTCKPPHLETQSHSIAALPFRCNFSVLRMLSRKARVASGSKAMRAVVCAKCGSKVSRGKGSAAPSPRH